MPMSKDDDTVTAYRKSKADSPTRKGFGLMLGAKLRDRWVTPGASEIRLELEGVDEILTVRLRDGFWRQCPEFLHDRVLDWLESQQLAVPWPKGQPHRFAIERLTGTHFKVHRAIPLDTRA